MAAAAAKAALLQDCLDNSDCVIGKQWATLAITDSLEELK
jgi:hypothetical protein